MRWYYWAAERRPLLDVLIRTSAGEIDACFTISSRTLPARRHRRRARTASAQRATIKGIKANGNAMRETMRIAQWAMHGQLLLPADEETLDKLAKVSHSSFAPRPAIEMNSFFFFFPLFRSALICREKLGGKGCNYSRDSSSGLWVSHLITCKNSSSVTYAPVLVLRCKVKWILLFFSFWKHRVCTLVACKSASE